MVAFSDTHRVAVPVEWSAVDFAQQVLGHAPRWLTCALELRDRMVRRLGFATQPDRSRAVDLRIGGSAGPFVFTEVSPTTVRGGNSDKRMEFESTFRIEHEGGRAFGALDTCTHSNDRLGAVYLTLIWPAHKVAMRRVLLAGMAGVDGQS